MTIPHVVYFGQTPDQGTGSPIIILRHLQRLAAKGWRVSILGENGGTGSTLPSQGWPVYHLSLRKKWWPPFRPENPLLRKIRMRLWARECEGFFEQPPQAILSYLSLHSELPSEVAAHYATRCGAPLSVIVHDYPPDFPGFQIHNTNKVLRRQNWILSKAQHVWFASPELAARYDVPPEKAHILTPIPEGNAVRARWKPSTQPLIVYAGFSYPAQIPLFRKLARAIHQAGGKLLLLSRRTPELDELCRTEPVERRDLFATNREALDFVSSTAAALLVSYCERVKEMPWIATSFPSKFAEFSHTSLPSLIVAPGESAIGKWAIQRNYPDFLLPENLDSVQSFVQDLKNEAAWSKKSDAVSLLAQTEFHPDVIQGQLESKLTTNAPR